LYHVIRHEHFTIVHTHNPKPGLLGQLAARMANVPIVINTLHGFYFHDNMSLFWRRFYITMEKIAARCSDVILSQNHEDIQTAIREGICPAYKIKLLGNGIDLDKFDSSKLTDHAIIKTRESLGLSVGAPVIGFVGRLVREKGILELLQAIKIVRDKMPDVRLLIIGPVDKEKSDAVTPDIAHQYDIADNCIFTGLRHDMPELYALMNVFVLPSHREGFPRSPMEASAMGVPCIVTDIRGCREVVEHGRNGLLVPLGDVSALANGIFELLTNHEKSFVMGKNGYQIAKEKFDEQIVFNKVKQEYIRLLKEKGASKLTLTVNMKKLTHNLDKKILDRLYPIAQTVHRKGLEKHKAWQFVSGLAKKRFFRHSHDLPQPYVIAKRYDLQLYVPREVAYVYIYQDYERLTRLCIQQNLQPGMVAVDVGANIGVLSLIMAKSVGTEGKVYAVEPEPNNIAFLRKNIIANQCEHVEVVPHVAGAFHIMQDFYVRHTNLHHSLYPESYEGEIVNRIPVHVMPLDKVISEKVDFVKMDVEGAELKVLQGMKRIVADNPHIKMIVEWSPISSISAGYRPQDLPQYLWDLGFELTILKHNPPTVQQAIEDYHAKKVDKGWFVNIFAERKNV